jgi:hypothetical protein
MKDVQDGLILGMVGALATMVINRYTGVLNG